MEIIWYGHSCFRIGERGRWVVTDPFGPELGYALPRLSTTVVTVSRQHEYYNNIRAVRGSRYTIEGPGEYEVGGIFVVGVSTDTKDTTPEEKSTAYLIELDDMIVCHLGCLSQVPSQEQLEAFENVDVLLVPVGGRGTLTGTRAAEVVSLLEPSIVIPMHYKTRDLKAPLETTTRFLREMAMENPQEVEALSIAKSNLPEETQVVLLEPKR